MFHPAARSLARLAVVASMVTFAAHGHAATGAVTPAFAACSKALIETLEKSATTSRVTLKAPSRFLSDVVDPNAFTVIARNQKTKALLAKASCKATPEGEIVSFRTLPTS